MIDDLLDLKRISPEEHDIYMLFQVNDLGRKCLDKMMLEAFMDEPSDKQFSNTGFAFYDGRRSLLRDIKSVIKHVESIIQEVNNAGK